MLAGFFSLGFGALQTRINRSPAYRGKPRGKSISQVWQEGALSFAALRIRIRKLIPKRDDSHYNEIVRSFGNGALRAPAAMSDRELAHAIADFLKDSPSAESVGSFDRRVDPSSPL
jgi:hypothetical protein